MESCSNHSYGQSTDSKLGRLRSLLQSIDSFVIAVSGGVDSMLLSVIAGRMNNVSARMVHAVSPAVSIRATNRVRDYARKENWQLMICDAGEFSDERYMSNPVDRCFYCKFNLYQYIDSKVELQILSGTNQDDLDDFRPGLNAAEQYGVRHPYVEVGIDKATIRDIARTLDLHKLSELPASPCLSSRVETGIRIDGEWLRVIDLIEQGIRHSQKVETVRCRVRREGIVVELAADTLSRLDDHQRHEIESLVNATLPERLGYHPIRFGEYRMGSAFTRVSR
ncbi:MAG: hypothetical protein OXI60_09670 [Acidiferrobacterales bacterium]|nr:hypothetical protein [Acidiferrobacterales bacterium]